MHATVALLVLLAASLLAIAVGQSFTPPSTSIAVTTAAKVQGDQFFGVGFSELMTLDTQHAPNLTVTMGVTYTFNVENPSIHPFYIGTSSVGEDQGMLYGGISSGSFQWTPIPSDAAQPLFYQCVNHANMGNQIFIVAAPVSSSTAAAASSSSSPLSSSPPSSSPSSSSPSSSSPSSSTAAIPSSTAASSSSSSAAAATSSSSSVVGGLSSSAAQTSSTSPAASASSSSSSPSTASTPSTAASAASSSSSNTPALTSSPVSPSSTSTGVTSATTASSTTVTPAASSSSSSSSSGAPGSTPINGASDMFDCSGWVVALVVFLGVAVAQWK